MPEERLILGVDPRPAEEGFQRYEQAAERAVGATNRAAGAIDVYERAMRDRLGSSDILAAVEQYDQRFGDVAEATEAVATKSTKASAGLSRLNYSLASVARQAAGVHPVVGQLANTVSTFAVGSVVTVGVLAGLAAIGVAIRKLGEEGRAARERLEDAKLELLELARIQGLPVGGENVERVGILRQELNRLVTERDRARAAGGERGFGEAGRQFRRAEEEIAELERAILAGEAEIERARQEAAQKGQQERVDQAKELHAAILIGMREVDARIMEQIHQDRLASEREYFEDLGQMIAGGSGSTAPPRLNVTGAAFQKAAEEQQLVITERRLNAERELRDLERDRARAHIALVHSLENVGRAYGGVTEQILSLVAAVMTLQRMPGFGVGQAATTEDMIRGYGSSLLAGVGYGASSGNAFVGAVGGGASGWALTGNPAGMILGAVGGIVSGLIEHGRRAEQAQRIWRNALQDFSLMFDELTPIERNIESLNNAFEELSGGRSIEEVREDIEGYIRSIELGRNPLAQQAIEEQLARDQELVRQYEENAQQARDLAEAENELYQSRTQALNAPDGLRLELLEWRAAGASSRDPFSFPGTRDTGSGPPPIVFQGDVTFRIDGSGDPEATGEAVWEVLRRESLRGGPTPYEAPRR